MADTQELITVRDMLAAQVRQAGHTTAQQVIDHLERQVDSLVVTVEARNNSITMFRRLLAEKGKR